MTWGSGADDDRLGDVGEGAALARIIPRLPRGAAERLGPGDDAAVLAASDGRVVLTTDVMVEGPDFRRAWSSPNDLGWKAAATNLADVAAMGAVPTGLLIALAAPGDTRVRDLEAVADGFAAALSALAPDCGVLGGDLTVSPVLMLAVTAAGSLEGRDPVRRDGARDGDVIAYAGRLGLAGAALSVLFAEGVDADGRPDAAVAARLRNGSERLLAAQLAPAPPVAAGPLAALAGARAMLDVSDGLLLDAGRIARASGAVLDLDRAALAPFAAEVQRASELGAAAALEAVLIGGEDHGLLACFPATVALPSGFVALGSVRAGDPAVLLDGAVPDVLRPGWDSFTAPSVRA